MRARTSGRARLPVAAAAVSFAALLAGVALRSRGDAPPAPQAAAQAVQPELPVPPAPTASVPPQSAPPARPAAGPASTAPLPTASEDELMARLRAEVDANPQAAIALADDGERRYAVSQYSDERAFLKIRGLVHLGDIGVARDAARQFYERYPDSPLARFVFRLTGMRPMPPLGPPR